MSTRKKTIPWNQHDRRKVRCANLVTITTGAWELSLAVVDAVIWAADAYLWLILLQSL